MLPGSSCKYQMQQGRGSCPGSTGNSRGNIFVVVYKNIFTFKGRPTIELNYVFDIHAEGCSSKYVPMGGIIVKFKTRFFQSWVINLITRRLLRFRSESLGTKSRPIDPFNLPGSKSGHGSRTTRRRVKRFALLVLKQYNKKGSGIVR